MSNLEVGTPAEVDLPARVGLNGPVFERLDPRPVVLTPRTIAVDGNPAGPGSAAMVQRYLPTRGRRTVGAWCFLDLFGPDDVRGEAGMQIAPHPHSGLQTVTWLLAGDVRHRDSLGSDQIIRPGQLNLMSAGHGIAHAENSPTGHGDQLHGVQLWIALPDADRDASPFFEHHEQLPEWRGDGVRARLLMGSLGEVTSPATALTPLVGAELEVAAGVEAMVQLRPDWEHALLVLSGDWSDGTEQLWSGDMAYLGTGRSELAVHSNAGARLLLLGGEPFDEELVMWWNFVGRSHDEILAARTAWMAGQRFGDVAYEGDRLPAPPIPPVTLRPRGRR
ncbi:pirin family protein [Jatrophihabitans telluris]|uniref:Pirin family protein n=1 Tax=Jatrophihabitans telluris TaxID=2038343 RepID=A0ABY4QWY9_9ACTN|nr:pirin family protein [Jatrophihabitans telluris]UQX87782.1 pirin family protein [Jatrophihabitans telluris]